MDKDIASLRLGGEEQAARWIGISAAVYKEWPARLHRVMTDRVYAAVIRRDTAKAMGLTAKQWFADPRNEIFIESMIDRISIAAVVTNLQGQVPHEFARAEHSAEAVSSAGGSGPAAKSKRRKLRDNGKELAVEGLS